MPPRLKLRGEAKPLPLSQKSRFKNRLSSRLTTSRIAGEGARRAVVKKGERETAEVADIPPMLLAQADEVIE